MSPPVGRQPAPRGKFVVASPIKTPPGPPPRFAYLAKSGPARVPKPSLGLRGSKTLSAGFGPGGSGYPKATQAPSHVHDGGTKWPNKPPTEKLMTDELIPSEGHIKIPGVNGRDTRARSRNRQIKRKERELREVEREANGGQLA